MYAPRGAAVTARSPGRSQRIDRRIPDTQAERADHPDRAFQLLGQKYAARRLTTGIRPWSATATAAYMHAVAVQQL